MHIRDTRTIPLLNYLCAANNNLIVATKNPYTQVEVAARFARV